MGNQEIENLPVIEGSTSYEFSNSYIGYLAQSEPMTIRNVGYGTLTITSIEGIEGTDLSTTLDPASVNIIRVDMTGQITVSAALYLHATGAEKYREIIDKLIAASLSKDREHKYIVDLLSGIWGEDYKLHAEELKQESDNFRRIYKRVYVNDII